MVGVTLTGCIEEFEADIPAEDSELLVVEGSIVVKLDGGDAIAEFDGGCVDV